VLDVVLLESANNYAESLVVWAFGSETEFLAHATRWLDAHSMDNPVNVPGIGSIDNTNELVGESGVNGIKTGSLFELLFASEFSVGSETVVMVGVVLGAIDRGRWQRRTGHGCRPTGLHCWRANLSFATGT
jgi:D-alanyl-D-alanine carboxypeptidase (penicillin-binding protein 5/6)